MVEDVSGYIDGLYWLCLLFRWTAANCHVIQFSPATGPRSRDGGGGSHDGGLSEEVLRRYRTPTNIDDVVQQRTLTVEMNCNNYVHRMHDLLRLEEHTQAKLIAE